MNSFNAEHKAALDQYLLNIPGVTAGKAFGYPAYKSNGKLFAFVEKSGIVLKLPEKRIRELVQANEAMRWFEPIKGMIWGDWVAIQRLNPADYWLDLGLFEEAACFAQGSEPSVGRYTPPARMRRQFA